MNNAGWATFGEVEWVSMDNYKKAMDVNLNGAILGMKHVMICVVWLKQYKWKYVRTFDYVLWQTTLTKDMNIYLEYITDFFSWTKYI